MQVVILAGGLATRMRPLADVLPKSLFPVGGRPFLAWQLERLATSGATRVLVCAGHGAAALRAHVAAERPSIDVTFCEDGPRALGTGGALRAAVASGLTDAQFVVTYGDSYLPVDLRPVFAAHVASGAAATMVVHPNADRWDRSNVVVGEGRVLRYEKHADPSARPPDMRYIDYGFSVLDRRVVADATDPAPFDLAALLGRLATQGRVEAHEATERFYEIGSPAGLAELEQLLA